MPQLPPEAASRLSKICGLLGSDQDGERSAAAYQATRLLQSHGLTWAELIDLSARQTFEAPIPSSPDHVEEARWALQHLDQLTKWERSFLIDVSRRRSLTRKQAQALAGIVHDLRTAGAT